MEMSFDGNFEVGIPRADTFELLADPQKFVPVLPTFHSMSMKESDPNTAIVKVKVGVGRIHGIATTEMTLDERDAPTRARYVGKGNVMGGAYNMIVAFELADASDGGTTVNWTGTTQIYGKILSIAGGGMRGYAEKEINSVIDSLRSALASKEHFEAVSQAASAAAPPRIGLFGAIAAFFARLFGSAAQSATENATQAPHETTGAAMPIVSGQASRKTARDAINPVKPIQTSIQVDHDGRDSWVGQHLRRKEDERLVRGLGLFVDDYQHDEMLHIGFVRSPYAHAKILNIDTSAADALPGVVFTMTGAEVAEQTQPFLQLGTEPGALVVDHGIAIDTVRHQGEPIVMIVAESARLVEDAADLVEVEYEPLPVNVSSEDSLKDETIIHPAVGSNRIFNDVWDHGDVDTAFAEAAHVVKIKRMHFHRFSSTPIEAAATVASWSRRGDIEILSNDGLPGVTAQMLAGYLGVSTEQIRMRTHDIGGNFGTKTVIHPYIGLTAVAARTVGGRAVKWVETRSDNLASFHGGERTYLDTEIALDANGVIKGIRSRHLDDCGAFTRYEPLGCAIWSQVYCGLYGVRNIQIDFSQVVSNKPPCTPNRGYSRLQHLWFMERVLDICGHELGIAADEMRLRNYIRPEQMPYTTPNGCVYDSGDYPDMLEKAKDLIGYDDWRKKQADARAEGRLLGIGIGSTVDSGTNNFGQITLINPDAVFSGNTESCRIKIGLDGSIVAMLGSVPQGQGHETVTSQVIADDLNVGPDMVKVRSGFDSQWNSYAGLSGTIASQFVVTGLSAAHGAAEKLKAELKRLASFALEATPDELELGVGEMGPEVRVTGHPERAINFWMLSNLANCNTASVPEEFRDITLNVLHVYKPPFDLPDKGKKFGNLTLTYAAQIHISVVEVDPKTYQPTILDYVIVDDCGVAMNPKIVEGQVHGAACHGIGAAMQEAFQFDDEGNMITATFTDYAPMTSLNMPDLKCTSTSSPSPFSYNGAKGCGEGGGAPLHSVSAAVQDAMHELGVIVTDSHNSPTILMAAAANPNRDDAVSVESR